MIDKILIILGIWAIVDGIRPFVIYNNITKFEVNLNIVQIILGIVVIVSELVIR